MCAVTGIDEDRRTSVVGKRVVLSLVNGILVPFDVGTVVDGEVGGEEVGAIVDDRLASLVNGALVAVDLSGLVDPVEEKVLLVVGTSTAREV